MRALQATSALVVFALVATAGAAQAGDEADSLSDILAIWTAMLPPPESLLATAEAGAATTLELTDPFTGESLDLLLAGADLTQSLVDGGRVLADTQLLIVSTDFAACPSGGWMSEPLLFPRSEQDLPDAAALVAASLAWTADDAALLAFSDIETDCRLAQALEAAEALAPAVFALHVPEAADLLPDVVPPAPGL